MQLCIYKLQNKTTKQKIGQVTGFSKYKNKNGCGFCTYLKQLHPLGLENRPLYEKGVNQFRGNLGVREMFIVGFVVI